MIKRPFITFIIILSPLLLIAQNKQLHNNSKAGKPKLVIGIVVDQMRYDYLMRYYNKYGNGGFKRLMKEGFSYRDAEFNYVPTYTAPGHTAIYTGTTPSVNGMIANDWFDRALGRMVYCTGDTTVQTVGSSSKAGKMSPRRELVTTVGDALKLSDNGQSKVIGISLKDRASILPAGHSANAAYWFDDKTGNWISSTYYMNDLPEWVKKFNGKKEASMYLSKAWNTLLPINEYTESMKDNNTYEGLFKGEEEPVFPHNLPALMDKNGGYGLIKTTPFGDDITTDFVIEAIKDEQLGKGNATDMLTISYSSTDYIGHMYGTDAIETEDTYLRLDQDLSRLLTFLDTYIGKDNVLIFLTADHGAAINPQQLLDHQIPAGYVDKQQMVSGIKEYLEKKYGDSLISAFVNNQFYLNHAMLSAKHLNIDTVEVQVAALAVQYTGVERAIPACLLYKTGNDFIMKKIRKGYYPGRSGDVIINLLPEYVIYQKTGTTHGAPYIYDSHVPLIFYGGLVPAGSSSKTINITNIAPTVANLLDIAYPDGCIGHPLQMLSK